MSPLHPIRRREFLRQTTLATAALATTALGADSPTPATPRTASDVVPLGRTGLKLSRLGVGCGSNSGNVQRALGHDGFDRLIRHAYERGLTYLDTAQSYETHEWIRQAIKGLPRDRFFIQTKIGGEPDKPLELIDGFRRQLDTDYVDSLLVHCTVTRNWTDQRRRVMDAISEAQQKGWVRARGVSCHSLPALELAAQSDWVQVHLVRMNPQGAWIDTPAEDWNAKSSPANLPAVVEQVRSMRARGHGVIGMKLCGNGEFTEPAQREQAIRYVMKSGLCDAVVIGFKSPAEIDEAIERINRALATT